jgi:hypothetical protein
MSKKSLNMYQQIVDMELQDLENELANIQDQLINDYEVLGEIWVYHPANPDFINPIKVYDSLKKSISDLENRFADLELKIKALKSAN